MVLFVGVVVVFVVVVFVFVVVVVVVVVVIVYLVTVSFHDTAWLFARKFSVDQEISLHCNCVHDNVLHCRCSRAYYVNI